jgi:16S rRNA C1402 (ribose-2'-O) methylase RsmI
METRGEFVILIEGKTAQPLTDEQLLSLITETKQSGISSKELVAQLAEATGINKNRIYKLALSLKQKNENRK